MAEKAISIDKALSPLFPDEDYKDPLFVADKVASPVTIHTDNPERIVMDGLYVAKSRDQGDVTFIRVGTFTGKLLKKPVQNDHAQQPYLRAKLENEARAKALQEKEAAAKK